MLMDSPLVGESINFSYYHKDISEVFINFFTLSTVGSDLRQILSAPDFSRIN